jgi:hypothetical protein
VFCLADRTDSARKSLRGPFIFPAHTKAGRDSMAKLFRRTLAAGYYAALLVLAAGALHRVHAANPDTLTISVTPSVTYGVSIASVSSANLGYNFTTVGLGETTISTAAIVVTNTGNVSQYFSLAVSNTSGNWMAVPTAPSDDEFRMSAVLNVGSQPNDTSFTDFLSNSPAPLTAAGLYGQSAKTLPASTKNLWLRLEMPQRLVNGGTSTQTMTITVNGQGM